MQSRKSSKSDKAKNELLQKQKHRQGVAKKCKAASGKFVDMAALLAPAATGALQNWTWTTNDLKNMIILGFTYNTIKSCVGNVRDT